MTAMTDTLVVPRRPPALARLLQQEPALGPDHHWEGEFTGTRGAANASVIRIKARIGFHGDLIEGLGRCVNIPADLVNGDDSITLSGTLGADSVGFQLWFTAAPIGRAPLVSSGLLGHEGREISGDWSIGCFNPETCGCGGGGGTFHLRRID